MTFSWFAIKPDSIYELTNSGSTSDFDGLIGTDKLKLNYEYGELYPGEGNTDFAKNNGNISKQTITVGSVGATPGFVATQYYADDSLNRIQIATENITPTGGSEEPSWRQSFSFDRYGNRNFVTAGATPTTTLGTCPTEVCNPSISPNTNKITSTGYLFDAAGNTTRDAQDRKFTYDAENKQTKVESLSPGTQTVTGAVGEYVYDGDGRRGKKRAYENGILSEETIFVYDAAGRLIAEHSNQVASSQDAKVAYLTNDHLGSPRINTDINGNVAARHDYHPFGEEMLTSKRITGIGYIDDAIRRQFTGYERDDETELDYAQARYFTSNMGRFSSPDPLAASASSGAPQSWNRYSYSYNNPLRFTDPTGMIAGDFYDEEGRQIGTDGNPDGKKYFVSNKGDREKIRKTKGPYTTPVASAIQLPTYDARQEIGVAAVARSEAGTATDVKGGFHEEGGTVLNGVAIPAKPGPFADVLTDDIATIDPTITNDPSKQESVSKAVADGSLDTTYHVHPSGQKFAEKALTSTVQTTVGGTIAGPREFNQGPSPKDRLFAGAVSTKLDYHLVIAARDKQVHFYNSGGAFATMPLKSFVNIK